jgi:hypothetical protein
MRCCGLALALATAALLSRPALAQTHGLARADEHTESSGSTHDSHSVASATHLRWYGWQLLLSDAAAFGLYCYGSREPGVSYAGVGLFEIGGPGLHWAHGETTKAYASMASRVVVPLTLGLWFARSVEPDITDGSRNTDFAFAVGVGMGMLAVGVLDGPILGWERVSSQETRSPSHRPGSPQRWPRERSQPTFSSFVSWVPGGAYAGVVGQM